MAWALRARAPVAARSLSRATRSAPKAGALRARAPTCALRVTAHVVSWGGVGIVEDVVRCALLERLGAKRASSSCRGRGWDGTPREPQCRRRHHAQAERRYGGSWQEGGARAASPPLQGLTPPERRPRAAGAPWEARARAARVQTAGEDLVVGGGAHTNSELPQAGFPCSGEVPIRYSRTLHARALVINRDDDELFAGCRAGLVVHAEVALALTLTLTLPR